MFTDHDIQVIWIAAGSVYMLTAAGEHAKKHYPDMELAFEAATAVLCGATNGEQLQEVALRAEPLLYVYRLQISADDISDEIKMGYQLAWRLLKAILSENPDQEVCACIHVMVDIIGKD